MPAKRELERMSFYRVPLTIKVWGPLYASSPTSAVGIAAALSRNMPTEAQVAFREAVGEEIRPLGEIKDEMKEAAARGTEEAKGATTVFRRDEKGPYLHSNYLKGHLREGAETLSRAINFWGFQSFVTRTVWVTPQKIWLDPAGIKTVTTYFAPEVRLSTGVTVRQPTEKITEYVESPSLKWILYLLADPRWSRDLLEELVSYGAMRGLGPGRGLDESKYDFELGELLRVTRKEALERYRDEFREAMGMQAFG